MEYSIEFPSIPTAGVYYFTTGSGLRYEVRFGRRRDNVLHATIVFGVVGEDYDDEYQITNRGEVYRVMNTLIKAVEHFMLEHPKMVCYEFNGLNKPGEPEAKQTQRTGIYLRYLNRVIDGNWDIKVTTGNNILIKRKGA